MTVRVTIVSDSVPLTCPFEGHESVFRGLTRSLAVNPRKRVDLRFLEEVLVEVSGLEPPTSTLRT